MSNFENVVTPWGKSQGGSLLIPGIIIYHTASHGGMKVIKKLNDKIPAAFRCQDGWYEEDCDMNIPFFFYYDCIKQHCLENGLNGWSISVEEYFSKFTKKYFVDSVEQYYPEAYALHFGKQYTDAELNNLNRTRENFQRNTTYLLRKTETLNLKVKRGDTIIFDEPIRFTGGWELQEFTFDSRNNFTASNGMRVRISHWKSKLYRMK